MLKLKPLLMLTLTLNALLATQAQAAPDISYDKNGMPRCVSYGDRKLILLWNEKDPYARDIYTLDTGTYTGIGQGNYNCENLPRLSDLQKWDLAVLPKSNKVNGPFNLSSERLKKSLEQIRNGANSYRDEADAKAFLLKHPISTFTSATNRKLTAMYGVGFASELYAEVIAQDSDNKTFSDLIATNLHADPAQFAALKQNREVIYVKGLGHELPSAKKYDVLVDNLRAAGIPVKVVKTKSYDTIVKNAAVVKSALDMELKKGMSVILIGLSKGGSESLLGLSQLTAKLEGAAKPAGYGKVEAYLGLSGVYGGSFVLDWAGSYPQRLIFAEILKKQFRDEGQDLPSFDGVLDIRTQNIDAVMKQVARNGLPQETSYFSIVGTMLGDGLAEKGNYIRQLQDEMIRSQLDGYGANDGYIEYPGTTLPHKLVKKSYVATLNSSHALIDGTFLNEPVVGGKDNVVNAISISVLQLISK